MTTNPEIDPIDPIESDNTEVAKAGATTMRDRLRKRHGDLQGEHHLDLDIPGYTFEDGAALLARYLPLSGAQIDRMQNKMRKGKGSETLRGASDALILACEGMYVRQHEGADPEPLDPEEDLPIKYDQRLVDYFGLKGKSLSARQVLIALFPNEAAIIAQAQRFSIWMEDVTQEVDEDFLGE